MKAQRVRIESKAPQAVHAGTPLGKHVQVTGAKNGWCSDVGTEELGGVGPEKGQQKRENVGVPRLKRKRENNGQDDAGQGSSSQFGENHESKRKSTCEDELIGASHV